MKENDTSKLALIRIILKNGQDFIVKCTEFSTKTNAFGELTGYSIKGIEGNKPLYIRIPEIVAIVQILPDECAEEDITAEKDDI